MQHGSLAAASLVAATGAVAMLAVCLRSCRRSGAARPVLAHAATAFLLSAATTAAAAAALALAVAPTSEGVLRALVTAGALGATLAGWFLVRVATDLSWRPPPVLAWLLWAAPQVALVGVAAAGRLPADFGSVTVGLGALTEPGEVTTVSVDRALLLALWVLTLAHLTASWWRAPTFARRPVAALLLAGTLSAVTLLATVPHPDLLGGVDLVPLALCVSAVVTADALLRERLGVLVPPDAVHVLDTMDDAVVVVDPAGRLVAMNRAARRLTAGAADTPVDALLGRPVEEALRPAAAAAMQGSEATTSFRLGRNAHLEAHAVPLLDAAGHPAGTVVTCREVTDAVALRAQLEDTRTMLERERARLEDLTRRLMTELSSKEQERTRLAEDAIRDPLTGVHNRRRLQPAVAQAMARSRESGRPFAVMVVDVDHFKRVNDTYGHAVGDRVLQQLASELVIVGRPGDTVVRYGGEEFVVVVPDISPLGALQRAEEIRRAVGQLRVPVRHGDAHHEPGPADELRVTVSVGVACYPDCAGTVEELVLAADDALYAAKEAGRDCVVAA